MVSVRILLFCLEDNNGGLRVKTHEKFVYSLFIKYSSDSKTLFVSPFPLLSTNKRTKTGKVSNYRPCVSRLLIDIRLNKIYYKKLKNSTYTCYILNNKLSKTLHITLL